VCVRYDGAGDWRRVRPEALAIDTPSFLLTPNVRLFSQVDDDTVCYFSEQLARAMSGSCEAIVLELTRQGGDADVARRIVLEVRLY
jgi:hypothetical protein